MSDNATFHQQLTAELRTLVRSDAFPPGSKFLTEREIATRFSTSRPTANKALSSLVAEGLLETRRGAGTYVRETVLDYDLERLVSFTDKAVAVGKRPSTILLAYRTLRASDAPIPIREALSAEGHTHLVYMERVRLADDIPVILERRHVAAYLCPSIKRSDARGSLYAFWTQRCGLVISGADEVIHAVRASKGDGALLKMPAGAPCFKITATGFTSDGRALWHEETLYRADVYEFRNRIGGPGAALGRIKA